MTQFESCISSAAKQSAENSLGTGLSPSAAKASIQNKRFIAAVNRCATQKQGEAEFFRSL
jgi:hypothetical protein